RSCSMMHRASVVLPEPEPPRTAAWRFNTFLLSVMLLLELSPRPARMLAAASPVSSSRTESGKSASLPAGRDAPAVVGPQPVQSAAEEAYPIAPTTSAPASDCASLCPVPLPLRAR